MDADISPCHAAEFHRARREIRAQVICSQLLHSHVLAYFAVLVKADFTFMPAFLFRVCRHAGAPRWDAQDKDATRCHGHSQLLRIAGARAHIFFAPAYRQTALLSVLAVAGRTESSFQLFQRNFAQVIAYFFSSSLPRFLLQLH